MSHSSGHWKKGDTNDSHRALANAFAATILTFGRVVYSIFRFVFNILLFLAG